MQLVQSMKKYGYFVDVISRLGICFYDAPDKKDSNEVFVSDFQGKNKLTWQ